MAGSEGVEPYDVYGRPGADAEDGATAEDQMYADGDGDGEQRVPGAVRVTLSAYEAFLGGRVMTIPRIKNVTSHFTMKTVRPRP